MLWMSDFWNELINRDEKLQGVRDVWVFLFFPPIRAWLNVTQQVVHIKINLGLSANSVSVFAVLWYELALLISIVCVSVNNVILMFCKVCVPLTILSCHSVFSSFATGRMELRIQKDTVFSITLNVKYWLKYHIFVILVFKYNNTRSITVCHIQT